jgi:hypothetical protein
VPNEFTRGEKQKEDVMKANVMRFMLTGIALTLLGAAAPAAAQSPQQVNSPPPLSAALPADFEGRWEGAVTTNEHTLRLALKLFTGPNGKAAATVISLDQGNQEFAASSVAFTGKQVQVEIQSIGASYSGTLGDGGEIAGTWTQGGANLALTLKRVAP